MNVVVGAGSGMGEAAARLLAGRGDLLLADRDGAAATAVARRVGGATDAVTCDISSAADLAALVARIDRLEALIVTAGLSPSMGDGRAIIQVNLASTASLLRSVDPLVGPGSAAVCFASIAAHGRAYPPDLLAVLDDPLGEDLFARLTAAGADVDDPGGAYSISKHGVLRLVRRTAAAWGARGGRAVSVSPGIIDTPMGQLEFDNQPRMKVMVGASAIGRAGSADEVARVAVFLASPAASFVTGCDVLVDGGLVGATLG